MPRHRPIRNPRGETPDEEIDGRAREIVETQAAEEILDIGRDGKLPDGSSPTSRQLSRVIRHRLLKGINIASIDQADDLDAIERGLIRIVDIDHLGGQATPQDIEERQRIESDLPRLMARVDAREAMIIRRCRMRELGEMVALADPSARASVGTVLGRLGVKPLSTGAASSRDAQSATGEGLG